MTVRLTMQYSDGETEIEEYEDFSAVLRYIVGPLEHPGRPTLMVMQELDAPEESTWGQVRAGDEVVAPDGSLWIVDTMSVEGSPFPVGLTSLDGSRQLAFNVTDDMPIMRRPGVLSAAAQLLHDVGLWNGR